MVNEDKKEEWDLESLEKTDYLPNRKGKFFADYVYMFGAAVAALLMLVAMWSK